MLINVAEENNKMKTKDLLESLRELDVLPDEEESIDDELEIFTHENGHEYFKVEKELSKGNFEIYKNLIDPAGVTTRYRENGKKGYKTMQSELEKNALESVGKLIGYFDSDKSDVLCIYVDNYEQYQQLYWAIHDFIESGSGRDAFNIYYLFICRVLGIKKYNDVKNIIEMLSNYESNAANLVMSHRDHYVHSVYVFLIGLAIYNSNSAVKSAYKEYYKGYHKIDEGKAYHQIEFDEHFIRFWGITSLFHDIGYIYEIPFEQIKSYGVKISGSLNKPFVVYKQADFWDDIRNRSKKISKEQLKNLCDCPEKNDKNEWKLSYSLDTIFVYHIKRRLKENNERQVDWKHVASILNQKATAPEIASSADGSPITNTNKIYMDHAYFSAKILFDILFENITDFSGLETTYEYMDTLTAVLMHNSLFKFVIRNGQPLSLEEHPLAFLLMLCDELQIWNRTSFGVNSRGEMHAMDVDMKFNKSEITCIYRYDKEFEDCATEKKEIKDEKKERELSKSLKDMLAHEGQKTKFLNDIEEIVNINSKASKINVGLVVNKPDFPEHERYLDDGLSDGGLLVIYDLANGLCKKKQKDSKEKEIKLEDLNLWEQNIYINRAKALDRYLWKRGYLYTDRKLGMHRVRKGEFTEEDCASFRNEEMTRLKEELIRYGMMNEKDNIDKVKEYGIIPSNEFADEIWEAVNAITGLSIYSFKKDE